MVVMMKKNRLCECGMTANTYSYENHLSQTQKNSKPLISLTPEITKAPSSSVAVEFLETIKDDESSLENLQHEIGRALKEDQKLTVT
jgi:hypothetical protein